jgi:hypothetical protein
MTLPRRELGPISGTCCPGDNLRFTSSFISAKIRMPLSWKATAIANSTPPRTNRISVHKRMAAPCVPGMRRNSSPCAGRAAKIKIGRACHVWRSNRPRSDDSAQETSGIRTLRHTVPPPKPGWLEDSVHERRAEIGDEGGPARKPMRGSGYPLTLRKQKAGGGGLRFPVLCKASRNKHSALYFRGLPTSVATMRSRASLGIGER